MEPFRQRRRIDHTKHKAFKHLAEFFQPSLPQAFAHKESAFSFKRCIDCSPPCANWSRCRKLLSLDGCKKYCVVGWWWSENYMYLFEAYVLKGLKNILYKNINSYQNRHIFKWNIHKATMLTVSRRIDKCPREYGHVWNWLGHNA